jgi:hypothetical protein
MKRSLVVTGLTTLAVLLLCCLEPVPRAEGLGFAAHVDYATGALPYSVAVGDFNGDGIKDLVTADQLADTVSVLLGDGSGGFGAKTDFATGTGPHSVAVGDFNGDGIKDLVTADIGADTVSVLLGDGSGGFAAKTDFATGAGPRWVAVGDFNADGQQDLVTANNGGNTVSVLLGNGNGTFQVKTDYAAGAGAYSVAVGDFNGDGKQDLAVANANANTGSVLLGNGDGTFAAKTDFVTGALPLSVVVGDFNSDGRQELAVANHDSNTVSVLLSDTTPPTTTDNALAGWQASSPVNVTLTPDDGAGSGIAATQYKIDGARSWSTGTTVPVSGDGTHTVHYRSTDMAGNIEETESCTVKIDTTAPTTTVHGVDSAWHAWPQTIFLTADDGVGSGMSGGSAKIEYDLDGGGWTTGDWLLIVADGDHMLQVRATDAVGNVETPATTYHVKVDRTAPTTADNAAAQPWSNSLTTITLTPSDALSGMSGGLAQTQYSTNGGATWNTTTLVDVHADLTGHTTDGLTVLYRSTDAAGNTEATKSCTAHIDTRGPTTSGSALTVKKGKKATFKIKIADPRPGSPSTSAAAMVQIKIKNAKGKVVKTLTATAPYSTNALVTLVWSKCSLAKGSYKYVVYATDEAGNAQVKAGGNGLIVK